MSEYQQDQRQDKSQQRFIPDRHVQELPAVRLQSDGIGICRSFCRAPLFFRDKFVFDEQRHDDHTEQPAESLSPEDQRIVIVEQYAGKHLPYRKTQIDAEPEQRKNTASGWTRCSSL